MKKRNALIVVLSIFISINAWASDLTRAALTGSWEFMHWAESGDLDNKHKVGIIMNFQSNGDVISKLSSGDVTEHYKLNGNTIIYSGKHGDQTWKLVSFSPGESLVVNHMGAIMTFEKR